MTRSGGTKPIKYDATFNLGQLITAGSLVLTIGGMIWWQATFQSVTNERLMQSELARERYIPKIESLEKTQDTTIDRFSNVGNALREVRDVTRQLTEQTAGVRERLAKIETILKINESEKAVK